MRRGPPRLLLLLALAGPSCALMGDVVHLSAVGIGAAAGALGGPALAATGAVAGHYGGEKAARYLTGTDNVRVGTGKADQLAGSGDLMSGSSITAPFNKTMSLTLETIALLAGLLYLWQENRNQQKLIDKLREEVDELWEAKK